MNVYLFLYDNFVDFEVVQALFLLRNQKLTTVGFTKGLVKAISGLQVNADISIGELDTSDVDVFIIPGGEPKEFIRNDQFSDNISILNEKLHELVSQNKIIAAICGGPTFLANAGILNDKKCTASIADDETIYYKEALVTKNDVEIDNNILTAQGHAFSLFAGQLGLLCKIFESEDQMLEAVNWFRNAL